MILTADFWTKVFEQNYSNKTKNAKKTFFLIFPNQIGACAQFLPFVPSNWISNCIRIHLEATEIKRIPNNIFNRFKSIEIKYTLGKICSNSHFESIEIKGTLGKSGTPRSHKTSNLSSFSFCSIIFLKWINQKLELPCFLQTWDRP